MTSRLHLALLILVVYASLFTTAAQDTISTSLLIGDWQLTYYTVDTSKLDNPSLYSPDEKNFHLVTGSSLKDVPRILSIAQDFVLKTDDKHKSPVKGTWKTGTIESFPLMEFQYKGKKNKQSYLIEKLDNDELVLRKFSGTLHHSSTTYLLFKRKTENVQPKKAVSETTLLGEWPSCTKFERTAEMDTVYLSRERQCFTNCTYYLRFRHNIIGSDTYSLGMTCEVYPMIQAKSLYDVSGTWSLDETTGILLLKNLNGIVFKFSVWMQDEEMILMKTH